MKSRKIYIVLALLVSVWTGAFAQDSLKVGEIMVSEDSVAFSDAYLDSVDVRKNNIINDYTLIGVQYGMGLNQMSWNPRMEQKTQFSPVNFGITWTRFCKMFGYMPYFGIQAGVFYAREGYLLEEEYNVQGAQEVTMDIVEVPVMAHFHFDFWKMKLMANIGFYGSYRLNIHRSGNAVLPAVEDTFLSTDRRFDYGIKGGAGFGFVFDPVEIHFTAMYKYGFGSLYEPDYMSPYYYRFASVSNFIFSVGLHFQITKRTGKTNLQLKREAREIYMERRNKAEQNDI